MFRFRYGLKKINFGLKWWKTITILIYNKDNPNTKTFVTKHTNQYSIKKILVIMNLWIFISSFQILSIGFLFIRSARNSDLNHFIAVSQLVHPVRQNYANPHKKLLSQTILTCQLIYLLLVLLSWEILIEYRHLNHLLIFIVLILIIVILHRVLLNRCNINNKLSDEINQCLPRYLVHVGCHKLHKQY